MRRLLLATLVATAVLVSGCATAHVLPDGRILLLAATGNKLFDPASGAATVTGSAGTLRIGDASAVLPDGKVLVTGGMTNSGQLASTEIWDPATGTFSPGPDMTEQRSFHTATTLADGRVLIVGGGQIDPSGGSSTPPIATAELYDPATGSFTATGSMPTGRAMHTATLLQDGRVLIAGGGASGAPTESAVSVLYDPKTGTFTPTGSMASARLLHTATRLADGRVLIIGGIGGLAGGPDAGAGLTTAEVFDPSSGTFTPTGPLGMGRLGQAATLLGDGRVLVAGGVDKFEVTSSSADASPKPPSPTSTSAELYDPVAGTFSPTGAMATARALPVAAPLPDGRVLVAGGSGQLGSSSAANQDMLSSAEIYDPASGTFSPVELPAALPMATP